MKNLLKKLFGNSEQPVLPPAVPVRKTLKDIVAGFQSTINDLESLTNDNVVKLNRKLEQAEDLKKEADVLSAEAASADKIAQNLKALLS